MTGNPLAAVICFVFMILIVVIVCVNEFNIVGYLICFIDPLLLIMAIVFYKRLRKHSESLKIIQAYENNKESFGQTTADIQSRKFFRHCTVVNYIVDDKEFTAEIPFYVGGDFIEVIYSKLSRQKAVYANIKSLKKRFSVYLILTLIFVFLALFLRYVLYLAFGEDMILLYMLPYFKMSEAF